MSDWICYLLISLTSNCTYIGSTNNLIHRLDAHNNNNPNIKRKGAKRTRGQTWVPCIFITGFENKNACLSFESNWKRLSHRRNNNRFELINLMTDFNLSYSKNTIFNRILDLLYFLHHYTLFDCKFKPNYLMQLPLNQPEQLTIHILMEKQIKNLPWPYFVCTEIVKF